MEINSVRDKVLMFFHENLRPHTIYLFGSFNTKYFKPDSDIDIAIIAGEIIDEFLLYKLSTKLGAEIGLEVHLIDFKNAPYGLKIEILKNGKVIYCNDDNQRLEQEMIALTQYQKLNEERSELLTDLFGTKNWM